jgi:hypothetical protein
MRRADYNSGIPNGTLKPIDSRAALLMRARRAGLFLSALLLSLSASAADWSMPEQQLARKIVAIIGPGTVVLTFENRSSLGRRDSDIVQNGLRSALEQTGIHLVKPEQAGASIGEFVFLCVGGGDSPERGRVGGCHGVSASLRAFRSRARFPAGHVEQNSALDAERPNSRRGDPRGKWLSNTDCGAESRKCLVLSMDHRRQMARRTGFADFSFQAVAIGLARPTPADERSIAGCVPSWRGLSQQCRELAGDELPGGR